VSLLLLLLVQTEANASCTVWAASFLGTGVWCKSPGPSQRSLIHSPWGPEQLIPAGAALSVKCPIKSVCSE
jgi:hypothetical protein